MLHVFPVTLQETRATVHKTHATLQQTPATLHETMQHYMKHVQHYTRPPNTQSRTKLYIGLQISKNIFSVLINDNACWDSALYDVLVLTGTTTSGLSL